jgi:hypothetical protein
LVPDGSHKLSITVISAPTYVWLDYFMVTSNAAEVLSSSTTTQSGSSSGKSHGTNIGVIGGAVGGIVGALLIALLIGFLFWRRRKQRRRNIISQSLPREEESKLAPFELVATLPTTDYVGLGSTQHSSQTPTTRTNRVLTQARGIGGSSTDGEPENTLATTCVEDVDSYADEAYNLDRITSPTRDTPSSDRELLEDILGVASDQANTANPVTSRGAVLLSSTINGGLGRQYLLELRGEDARAVLQAIQKVRILCRHST